MGNYYRRQQRKNKQKIEKQENFQKKLLTVPLSGVKIQKLSQKTRQQMQKESKENQGFSRGEPENFLQN